MSFKIVERVFSEDESEPTVLVANIYGEPQCREKLKKNGADYRGCAQEKSKHPDFS